MLVFLDSGPEGPVTLWFGLSNSLFALRGKAISVGLYHPVPFCSQEGPRVGGILYIRCSLGKGSSFVGLVKLSQGFPVLGHHRAEDAKERAGMMAGGKRDPSKGMVRPSALNHLYFEPPFPVAWGHTPGQTVWSSWR